MKKTSIVGLLNIAITCLCAALGFVYMGKIAQNIDPWIAAFATYGVTGALFFFLGFRRWHWWIEVARRQKQLLFTINLASLVMMVVGYEAMRYITPTSYVIVFFGVTPAFSWLFFSKSKETHELISCIILTGAGILFGFLANPEITTSVALGVLAIVFISFAGAVYLSSSSELQRREKLTSSDIMGLRFLILALVSGVLAWKHLESTMSVQGIWWMLAIVILLGGVVRLYSQQQAVLLLGDQATARSYPIIPILCTFFSLLLRPDLLQKDMIFASIAFSIVMIFTQIMRARAQKKIR